MPGSGILLGRGGLQGVKGESEDRGDEALCRQVARIMGQASSAAAALRLLEELRADGKEATVIIRRQCWIVREVC